MTEFLTAENFPWFNKVNDLSRLAAAVASDVYLQDEITATHPQPANFTIPVKDHPDHILGSGTRIYNAQFHSYHSVKREEFSGLYLVEWENVKYGFIAWKGTDSAFQGAVDLTAKFDSSGEWKDRLDTIVQWFIPSLVPYLEANKIIPTDYEWYTVGHSLGGALSTYLSYLLTLNNDLIGGGNFIQSITFSSMKLPMNVLLLPDGSDYAIENQVLEFLSSEDKLIQTFGNDNLSHFGHPIVDIQGFLAPNNFIHHKLVNFEYFLKDHYVDPENNYEILTVTA